MLRATCLLAITFALTARIHPLLAQTRASATPVPVVLLTATPEGREQITPTDTASPSPTAQPAVRLRALGTAGNVNIRALPSLDGDILGTIAAGVEYQVLRNYYRWYEFRYDPAPSGRGWVYGDLVEIVGDRSLIVIIDNPADIAAQAPIQGQSPSQTNSDDQRVLAISTIQADSDQSIEVLRATALPTFTPPAATPASFTQQLEVESGERPPWTSVPPIVPVAVLAGLGFLGFLLNALRR